MQTFRILGPPGVVVAGSRRDSDTIAKVGCAEVHEALAVKSSDPVNPGHPQATFVVLFDPDRDGLRQSVPGRIGDETPVLIPNQHAVLGRRPQGALPVLMQRPETLAPDAGRAPVEDDEPQSVEADQSAVGGEPEITVAGLQDVVDGVLRQAVLGGPRVQTGLRAGLGWRRKEREADDDRREPSRARQPRQGTRTLRPAPHGVEMKRELRGGL